MEEAEAGLRKQRRGPGHAGPHALHVAACVRPPCPRVCIGPHVGPGSPSAGQEGAAGDLGTHLTQRVTSGFGVLVLPAPNTVLRSTEVDKQS